MEDKIDKELDCGNNISLITVKQYNTCNWVTLCMYVEDDLDPCIEYLPY